MISLPLHYQHQRVGFARAPEDFDPLTEQRWSFTIPRRVYAVYSSRPDVLLATFLEDPSLLKSCHPYLALSLPGSSRRTRVYASKLAIRPAVIPLVLSHLYRPDPATLLTISTYLSNLPRVLFLDSNRCNLSRDNLREVVAPTEGSSLIHPGA